MANHRWGWLAVLGIVAALLVAWPAAAEERGAKPRIQENRERLREIRREIDRERERAREAGRKEQTVSQELQGIDQELKRKARELSDLQVKLRGGSERLARLNKEIAATELRLIRTRTLLARRLRAIYKQGSHGYVRVLLSADDLAGAGRRFKYLSAIAGQDHRLMGGYEAALADLSRKREDLERYKADIAEAQAQAQAKRHEIEEEQRKRRVILARVREEKGAHLAAARELEAASRELAALIARLQAEEATARRGGPRREEAPVPDGAFAVLKGKLPWPTAGTLAAGFGRQEHPRFRTVTFNKGIEIAAPQGREILAVHDGRVLFADWFKGYGRLVILDHGGGYFTLYAHAAEILVGVGDAVRRNQPIARVGDSGSLEGPQLYFELRHKGRPLDPLAWLAPR